MKTYYLPDLKRILPDLKVPSGKSIDDYYKCVRYYYCLLVNAHSKNKKFQLYHMEDSELKEYLEYYIDNEENDQDTSWYPDHFRAFVALGPRPKPHTFTLRDSGGNNIPTQSREALRASQKQESNKKNQEGASHTLVSNLLSLTEGRDKKKECRHIEECISRMSYHNLLTEIQAYKKIFGDDRAEIEKMKDD